MDLFNSTSYYLAIAIVPSCSIIDFGAVVIEGACPESVKLRIVAAIEAALDNIDLQGLKRPQLFEGLVGNGARSLGAGALPIAS